MMESEDQPDEAVVLRPKKQQQADADKVDQELLATPSLEPPLRDSAPCHKSIRGSPTKTRPCSQIATKNTRKRMEDRHVILHDLKAYLPSNMQSKIGSDEHVSYYAVFDGHAGTDAAAYAAANLHELLVGSDAYPDNPVQAFSDAFIRCDDMFVASSKKSGSTAVCVLVIGERLYTAWLGDSQATLVRAGVPLKIIDPHKPNREDERARIEALGGSILHWGTWRVNGQLAVSRAIGDGEYKPYITAEPDVTTVALQPSDEFLIVACDGLWDTVTPEEATEIVYNHLEEKQMLEDFELLQDIGARLAEVAKEKGSGDNITIIVVFLRPVREVLATRLARAAVALPADIGGITSTSAYVLSPGSGRDSIEPPKDDTDSPSPNISFNCNQEGGAVFSPDPFGQQGMNGFDLSKENFDNTIDDKRFSNDSNGRGSNETKDNGHVLGSDPQNDEIFKEQSIAKVEDLFKMLDREDSSPPPEVDDDRPLEEILTIAREQQGEEAEDVEDDDSSEDEILEHRNGAVGGELGGNSQLEEVLQAQTPTLPSGFLEPVMEPCQQVRVVETGPEECGTIVPPAQELPSHQQPVLETVDPMTCSTVQEEAEQDGQINGAAELVSFEAKEEVGSNGFMLKTPGQENQQLSQFSPNGLNRQTATSQLLSEEEEGREERETSVDTGEDVNSQESTAGAAAGLTVPDLEVTPATPTRPRSPEQVEPLEASALPELTTTPASPSKQPTMIKTPGAPKTSPKTKKCTPIKPAAGTKPTSAKVVPVSSAATNKTGPSISAARNLDAKTPKTAQSQLSKKVPINKPESTLPKGGVVKENGSAKAKPMESKRNLGAISKISKPASNEQTENKVKPNPSVSKTKSIAESKPLTERKSSSVAERKPSTSSRPASGVNSKVASKTPISTAALVKVKGPEGKNEPSKRPTSGISKKPAVTGPARAPSSASSTSSAARVPRPASSTTSSTASSTSSRVKTASVHSRPATAPTVSQEKPTLSTTKTGAPGGKTFSAGSGRAASTVLRAQNSTIATKPSAAAERVAAARAAAKALKPNASKVKLAGASKKMKDTPMSSSDKINGAAVEITAADNNEEKENSNGGGANCESEAADRAAGLQEIGPNHVLSEIENSSEC